MLLIVGGYIRYNSIVLLSVFIVLLLIKSVSIRYLEKAVKTKKFDCKLNIQPLRQIYFPYSTVVVALFLSDCNPNTFSQQNYFQICVHKDCMRINSVKEKNVNPERSAQNALLDEFIKNHVVSQEADGLRRSNILKFQPFIIAYGNTFPIGYNKWNLVLCNNNKSIVYGSGYLEFMMKNASRDRKSFQDSIRSFEIQKGEDVNDLVYRYCKVILPHEHVKACHEHLYSSTMYDFEEHCTEKQKEETIFGEKICGSKRTRIKMDMVSVYNFDPFVKVKQVLMIDDKLYNVLVDVTSRQSICSTFGMFCIEKNLNPKFCQSLANQFFKRMSTDFSNKYLHDPYLAHYNPKHFYLAFGKDLFGWKDESVTIDNIYDNTSVSNEAIETNEWLINSNKPHLKINSNEILYMVSREEEMIRDTYGNGKMPLEQDFAWGRGEDIIYFQRRDFFKSLSSLYNVENKNTFRPCVNWVLIVAEDTYVNKSRLLKYVSSLDSTMPYYIGNGLQINKTNLKFCNKNVDSNWFPLNGLFASFAGGFLISRGLLYLLKERIIEYMRPLLMGYGISRSYCYDMSVNDVRFSGCLKHQLGISLISDKRFGSITAPSCNVLFDDILSASSENSDENGYITIRHATAGRYCKENRNSQKTKDMLNNIIIGITTYENDRDNALDSIRYLINSSTYNMTSKNSYALRNENIFVYDDIVISENMTTATKNKIDKYPKGIHLRTSPRCQSSTKGWHCLQEKMIAAVFDMSYFVYINKNIKFAIFGDCDQSYNMLDLAEVFSIIDYNKILMIGDLWKGHSDYPYLSGGGLMFTREWMVNYYKYVLNFYDYHHELPLSGKYHKRRSLNGIHGCDSFMTYITLVHLGGRLVDLPGIYGYNALCTLPSSFLVNPVLSVHGLNSRRKKLKNADNIVFSDSNYFDFGDQHYTIYESLRQQQEVTQNQPSICLYGSDGHSIINNILAIGNALKFLSKKADGQREIKDNGVFSLLGLDDGFMKIYQKLFDKRKDIVYAKNCKRMVSYIEMFYSYGDSSKNTNQRSGNIQLAHLVPKNSIRRQAESIVANNTFVSVHRSWVSGECYALLNNKNCFCNISGTSPTGIANTAFYCGITEEHINGWNETGIPVIFFTGDGKIEYDKHKNFEKVDHHPFEIQLWMMVLSKLHYGNPMSSIDYLIYHWRYFRGKQTEPTECYNGDIR